MKIKVENLGTIKSAAVAFNGLTVIGGENDTGKSTVGKLMFAIVKAINRYEQEIHENKEQIIFKMVEQLYFNIRHVYDFRKNGKLREEFFPPNFITQLKPFLVMNEQTSLSPELSKHSQLESIFKKKTTLLNQAKIAHEPWLSTGILDQIEKIKQHLLREEDKGDAIKRALSKALVSEFYFELTPMHSKLKTHINFSEGENNILDIEIKSNKITAFNLQDVLPFDDVTFIEAPVLLQMYDVVHSANTLFEISNTENKNLRLDKYRNPNVSFHIKDLISKLENAQYFPGTMFDFVTEPLMQLAQDIGNIVNGGFSFDKDEKDFSFSKKLPSGKDAKIKSVNTASGIKAFGIIQLLILAGILDERSLLIIDEPENHLHPRWQIQYARVLTELVKNNVSVLLASHSPYLLQAIKVFSEKNKIENRVNYYLGEKTGDGDLSEIIDVSDDLNRMFKKLAEPLYELVWK
ncbi:MAG TPA: AAA family ATPase [Candidatus Deferrimicrobium sp.]|nr:AAA family ATPase [Candidatus Deferrimicrobium sp.]